MSQTISTKTIMFAVFALCCAYGNVCEAGAKAGKTRVKTAIDRPAYVPEAFVVWTKQRATDAVEAV